MHVVVCYTYLPEKSREVVGIAFDLIVQYFIQYDMGRETLDRSS